MDTLLENATKTFQKNKIKWKKKLNPSQIVIHNG